MLLIRVSLSGRPGGQLSEVNKEDGVIFVVELAFHLASTYVHEYKFFECLIIPLSLK